MDRAVEGSGQAPMQPWLSWHLELRSSVTVTGLSFLTPQMAWWSCFPELLHSSIGTCLEWSAGPSFSCSLSLAHCCWKISSDIRCCMTQHCPVVLWSTQLWPECSSLCAASNVIGQRIRGLQEIAVCGLCLVTSAPWRKMRCRRAGASYLWEGDEAFPVLTNATPSWKGPSVGRKGPWVMKESP